MNLAAARPGFGSSRQHSPHRLRYDAFYTDRYMGLPSENPEGYRSTAAVLLAEKLQGRVMLIHGEAVDDVHPAGALRMAKALQKAGKDFRLMITPEPLMRSLIGIRSGTCTK